MASLVVGSLLASTGLSASGSSVLSPLDSGATALYVNFTNGSNSEDVPFKGPINGTKAKPATGPLPPSDELLPALRNPKVQAEVRAAATSASSDPNAPARVEPFQGGAPQEWGNKWITEVDGDVFSTAQLDSLIANTPSVVMFFAGSNAKGHRMKPVMARVAEHVNTHFFSRGTRPLVRFVLMDAEKHARVQYNYGVSNVTETPTIIYFPGQGLSSRDSRQTLPVHELDLIEDENGMHDANLEDFVRDAHTHAYGNPWWLTRPVGTNVTQQEAKVWSKIPANCDGDECNNQVCPPGTQKTIELVGYTGDGPHGDCICKCYT